MRRLVYILLAVEVALLVCALSGSLLGKAAGNAAVLLLAANSVALIWCAKTVRSRVARKGQKPSCCR
jgi:membrane protein implicated in regulation of membrane protease activity